MFLSQIFRPRSPSISSLMKTYTSAYMQGSGIPRGRWKEWSTEGAGNKGVPCREFKNRNKLTKSQPAFYYHFARAIVNNSHSSQLRLTAPIIATSLGPPLAPVFSIIWSVLRGLSFNLHFTGRKRGAGDCGKWEDGDLSQFSSAERVNSWVWMSSSISLPPTFANSQSTTDCL